MSENLLKGIAEPLHFIAVGQGNSFKFSQAVFCLGGGGCTCNCEEENLVL